ncbi:MAG: HD-GYP domain-containing protein [bacterium]|nr:HD-GYP domain-containing protein [bacterium]
MKKIKVTELKPGMIFDQPVYIDPTNVLVQARQEIMARDIERLVKWGILEVETNGQIVGEGKSDDAAQEPAAAAPAAASGAKPAAPAGGAGGASRDAEIKAVAADYEVLRKYKRSFRNLVVETGEVLQTNIQALVDNKNFDNRAVIGVASRLVEELTTRKLLLVALRGLRYGGNWTVYHSIHATAYGIVLGHTMNYSRPKLQDLAFAMLLMDVGMHKLPGHIREKAAELTDTERTTVKTHPLIGYKMLTEVGKVKASLATIALQHHEAFDGSGYPQGLKGGQIEELTRIAAITDSYTAMIEGRPYRKAILPYDAMKNMLSVQMARFDPKILRTFLGRISIYPLGSLVQLSNQQIGMVVGCRPDKPLRPILRLMRDENSLPLNGLAFVDLIKQTDVYIVKALEAHTAGIDLDSEV